MGKKVWLITGASSGLGLILTRKVLESGDYVIATSRTPDKLRTKILHDYGEKIHPLYLDLREKRSVSDMMKKAISFWGRIDVLVNNAGYEQIGAIEDLSEEELLNNFNVNFFGAFRMIKNVLPFMRENKQGVIFNISSIDGYCSWQGSAAYSSSKAALDNLSQVLSAEVASWNIKVLSVVPGQFRTDFFEHFICVEDNKSIYCPMYQKKIESLNRMSHNQKGDPAKLADLLLRLAYEKEIPKRVFVGEDAYKLAYESANGMIEDLQKYEGVNNKKMSFNAIADKAEEEQKLMNYKLTPRKKLNFVYHVADHCNLNCKGCDHCAPIAAPRLANVDEFKRDIERLSYVLDKEAELIELMGGEPLLHPELHKFVIIARNNFPKARIRIVTNGLLLNSQSELFWKVCGENNIIIGYTDYGILINKSVICDKGKKYGVDVQIFEENTEHDKMLNHVPFDVTGSQDADRNFSNCYHANFCTQLKNGKLYTCTIAANAEHFCEKFHIDMKMHKEDCIDIYQTQGKQEILDFLCKPIPFCKYCDVKSRTRNHPWTISSGNMWEWKKCIFDSYDIKELKKYNKIFLYGAGIVANRVMKKMQNVGIFPDCVVVSENKDQNSIFCGIKKCEYMSLMINKEKDIFLVATSKINQVEIEELLVKDKIKNYVLLDERDF